MNIHINAVKIFDDIMKFINFYFSKYFNSYLLYIYTNYMYEN